jgi:hypothetical protein
MSNRVDFYQGEQTTLALPASGVSVLVDGALCGELEVLEVVRAGWPEFGWAKLAYNPAACCEALIIPAEEIETKFPMGKSICICRYYNGLAPGSGAFSLPIFCGQIEGIETAIGKKGEQVQITARDFSAVLERITVYGQHVAGSDGSCVFLAGLDVVFNPDGKGNASPASVVIDGKNCTWFCDRNSSARLWTYAEVVDYLLAAYLPAGQLHRPSIEQLHALTDGQVVRDLDVTGVNLLEALRRCCERMGLKFRFVPRYKRVGPDQALVFYRDGTGREVELDCQQAGQRLSISKTDVAAFNSNRNFYPVTHRYIGQGDFKVFEATFELVKAWDSALQSTNYYTFSPSTNPDFHLVKDVYRKWCLNEGGDYSGQPYNQGGAFDFSKIFGTGDFAHRRRRFWSALSMDKQGKSLGYFLQVSFDGGEHWWQYPYAFNNLLDECGIWLSSDQLDVDTWVAALKGELRFRITASVVSDERLWCVVADGPVGSVVPVVDDVITLPRQFKFREVTNQSIFAQAEGSTLGQSDEIDDGGALYEFVRKRAAGGSHVIERFDVQTLMVGFDYQLGDRVTSSPESRDLFSFRRDNRSVCRIERVAMDFRGQYTRLSIVRQRKR